MKKLFSSRLFAFVLGAVLFSGITSVFAYTLLAEDIAYTPKDTTSKVNNVSDAIDELYSKTNDEIGMELLWTNSNPQSAFNEQTINLDLSNYKYIAINATYGGNGILDDYYDGYKTIVEVGTTSAITGVYHSADGGAATVRKVTVNNSGVTFGIGKFYNGSNQTSSDYAVPLKIWGIK